jgi:D-psicose/D-tagatose/L-ribulose 3-epimerase
MPNPIGMNLLLWGTEMDDSLLPILSSLREMGFDGVEVPILDTDTQKWKRWSNELNALGMERVAVSLNTAEHQLISPDPAMRNKALEYNKKIVECAAALGARYLTGPLHSSLSVFSGKGPTAQELEWARENLLLLAEHAQREGITVGLEFLNRFESYLVTSTAELIALVDSINHPNCKMMFDTFHANIEEKDPVSSIHMAGDRIIHVQLSENDRSTLGSGQIDFPATLAALKAIGYEGMISIEAFSTRLTAANIWRKMFASEMELAKQSIQYIKQFI